MPRNKQDPKTLQKRRAAARKMLRAGRGNDAIQKQLKQDYGMGLGTIWLNEEKVRLKAAKPAPKLLRAIKIHKGNMDPPPDFASYADAGTLGVHPEVVATPDPRIVTALLAAKTPFSFDGKVIKLQPV